MLAVFRADSSNQIGSGHISRCLSLAKALRHRGFNCLFICRDHEGNFNSWVTQAGFQLETLPLEMKPAVDLYKEKYQQWVGASVIADSDATIAVIRDKPVYLVIVDHYGLDVVWEEKIRPYTRRILAIDDLANRCHSADYLLDQNLVADYQSRYLGLLSKECVQLLGPDFALLQSEYSSLRSQAALRAGPVKRILVYFGGSDEAQVTQMAIEAFLALSRSDIRLDVVINEYIPNAHRIAFYATMHSNIHIHSSLPTLAYLILKSDLAIGAAGASVWERCCLGLPSIVISLAENQHNIAAELEERGLVRWLGQTGAVSLELLTVTIESVLREGSLEQWSQSCLNLLDGFGANRVASLISLCKESQFKVRPASHHDKLEPPSHPTLSSNTDLMLTSNRTITSCEYSSIGSRLRDPENHRVYVCETDAELPLGKVFFERVDGYWRISYSFHAFGPDTSLRQRLLEESLLSFQRLYGQSSLRGGIDNLDTPAISDNSKTLSCDVMNRGYLSLAICSDKDSWLNASIAEMVSKWLTLGHSCHWVHDADTLRGGDICFYLSYSRISSKNILSRFRNNVIVHASDLPKGRGWSPASWLILSGESRIPLSLLEAAEKVDSGDIYEQVWIELDKRDLIADWRNRIISSTKELVFNFVDDYPNQLPNARRQSGEPHYYPRRRAEDSELDPNRTILEQFDLLRIVDNQNYPAFFRLHGEEFVIHITKRQPRAS